MKLIPFSLAMAILLNLLVAFPAGAWDGVQVVDSAGFLRQEFFGAPSPTPGYCYWDKDPSSGPDFHATEVDGHGNNDCTFPWLVHCDGDSLAYRGSWPFLDYEYILSGAYSVELSCDVEITAATRLTASRAVAGVLDEDEHTLILGLPEGGEVVLLAPGSGPDQVEMNLEPGNYQVSLEVDAYQGTPVGVPIDPYEGRILLKWEDPTVAASPTSWGSLKAVFR